MSTGKVIDLIAFLLKSDDKKNSRCQDKKTDGHPPSRPKRSLFKWKE